MRRLAERLGVAPNAIYSHFEDKSAVVDAVVDALLADLVSPVPDQETWRDGLLRLMRSTRALLLTHADLIPIFLSRPTRGPNATRLADETLTHLARAGLQGREAVDALRILLTYVFGFAAQEAPRRADPKPERRRLPSRAAFEGAERHPRVRELATRLAEHPDHETFERGLAWLLDGITGTGLDTRGKSKGKFQG